MMVAAQVRSHVVCIGRSCQRIERTAKVAVLQAAVHVVIVGVDAIRADGVLRFDAVYIDAVHGGVRVRSSGRRRVEVIAVVGGRVLDLAVVMGTGRMVVVVVLIVVVQIVFDVVADAVVVIVVGRCVRQRIASVDGMGTDGRKGSGGRRCMFVGRGTGCLMWIALQRWVGSRGWGEMDFRGRRREFG